MTTTRLAALVLFLASCSESAEEAGEACELLPADVLIEAHTPGIACSPEGQPSTGDIPFSRDTSLCVQIEMDEAARQSMTSDSRFGSLANGCFSEGLGEALASCDEPIPQGFTWHSATVTVNGRRIDNVGIRKKGTFGSIFTTAPSLKIRTDRNVEGQRFGDTKRLTLNNNAEDPSKITSCVIYAIFERAGVPAPRCNQANVMINGEALGAYSHVESVKRPFLRRVFGNDTGSLYEGAFADFEEAVLGRWEAKTSDTDESRAPIADLTRILSETSDDALLDALSPHLNLDAFLRFWAVEVLTVHEDGYSRAQNNYYVYFDPDDAGRASFIPWSVGGILGGTPLESFTAGRLTYRLAGLAEVRTRFAEIMREVLDTAFVEEDVLADIDAFGAQAALALDSAEARSHRQAIRQWVGSRRAQVEAALEAGFGEFSEAAPVCEL